MEEANAQKAELDAKVKAATTKDKEEEGEEVTDDEADFRGGVAAIKKELTAARKKVKQLEEESVEATGRSERKLSGEDRRDLVLELSCEALAGQLERYVAAHNSELSGSSKGCGTSIGWRCKRSKASGQQRPKS